ncbi:hypothetical protein bcgnr5378_05920 [Bacillus cereus]|uniref:Lipoprotein n=1 Tax=Bacillus cereus TaxID=1396 RepID=A0A164LBH4_BACCE|nr:hypothetical protein [Bacillus cereus]KZD55635.1 hypothetical protein B4088_5380 [Bacillus cereus]
MKLTKKTKAVILTGVLALSIGALSGCSSKDEAQSKNGTTVLAESEKVVEVHGAKIVKENLLQFLQMDSKEAESFAKKNISNKIVFTELIGPVNAQSMPLESDHKGINIYSMYDHGKNSFVGFRDADNEKAIANSFEEAASILNEYGVSKSWKKNNNEEIEVASKEKSGRYNFISNIEDKPVNVLLLTDLQGNTEIVKDIFVFLINQ